MHNTKPKSEQKIQNQPFNFKLTFPLLITVVAILGIFVLVLNLNRRQELRSRADIGTASIAISPLSGTFAVNDTIAFDLIVPASSLPLAGAKVRLIYDTTYFSMASNGIEVNQQAFNTTLVNNNVTPTPPDSIAVHHLAVVQVDTNPASYSTGPVRIGTVRLTTKAETASTTITFQADQLVALDPSGQADKLLGSTPIQGTYQISATAPTVTVPATTTPPPVATPTPGAFDCKVCDWDGDNIYTQPDAYQLTSQCIFGSNYQGLNACLNTDINADGVVDAGDISACGVCVNNMSVYPNCRNCDRDKDGTIQQTEIQQLGSCPFVPNINQCHFRDSNADGIVNAADLVYCSLKCYQGLKPPCPADLNGDRQVDKQDMDILVGQWGVCTGTCTADFNNDGAVTGADLSFLVSQWGACPVPGGPTPTPSTPPPPIACSNADLNSDGQVDKTDLDLLITQWWGACPATSPCPADFNGDGNVNAIDLSMFLTVWGSCTVTPTPTSGPATTPTSPPPTSTLPTPTDPLCQEINYDGDNGIDPRDVVIIARAIYANPNPGQPCTVAPDTCKFDLNGDTFLDARDIDDGNRNNNNDFLDRWNICT